MAVLQIQKKQNVFSTTNYSIFLLHPLNRGVVKNARYKKTEASLIKFGWDPGEPMKCESSKDFKGKFIILDGHRRFQIARELGIEVCFVVSDRGIPITEQNGEPWRPEDYLGSYVREGKTAYLLLQEYRERTNITLSNAVSMFSGESAGSGNMINTFNEGKFKIIDREHPEKVGDIVVFLREIGFLMSAQRLFVQALSKMCRVPEFNVSIFKKKSRAHSYLFGTRKNIDEYLMLIENVYNRNSRKRLTLKSSAEEIMRQRSAVFRKNRI